MGSTINVATKKFNSSWTKEKSLRSDWKSNNNCKSDIRKERSTFPFLFFYDKATFEVLESYIDREDFKVIIIIIFII